MESVARNLRNERPSLTARGRRIGIGAAMMLIAGLAFGLWLASSTKPSGGNGAGNRRMLILVWTGFLLGGLPFVGPPLLPLERRRRRAGSPWGGGQGSLVLDRDGVLAALASDRRLARGSKARPRSRLNVCDLLSVRDAPDGALRHPRHVVRRVVDQASEEADDALLAGDVRAPSRSGLGLYRALCAGNIVRSRPDPLTRGQPRPRRNSKEPKTP